MVGTKGGGSTGNIAWASGQLYSDGDGRVFVVNPHELKRTYLTNQQMWDRWDMARRFNRKVRVRVRAGRQQW